MRAAIMPATVWNPAWRCVCVSPCSSRISRRTPGRCCVWQHALAVEVDLIEPCGFLLDDRRLQARRPRLCRRPRAPPPRLVDGVPRRPRPAIAADPDDDERDRRAASFRFCRGRHDPSRPRERRRARGGASRRRRPESSSRCAAGARSLNVALAGAIALAEALRQTGLFPEHMTDQSSAFPPDTARCVRGGSMVRRTARPDLRRVRGDRGRIRRRGPARGPARPLRAPRLAAAGRRRRDDVGDARAGVRKGRGQHLDRRRANSRPSSATRSRAPRKIRASGRAASRWSPICARRSFRRRI